LSGGASVAVLHLRRRFGRPCTESGRQRKGREMTASGFAAYYGELRSLHPPPSGNSGGGGGRRLGRGGRGLVLAGIVAVVAGRTEAVLAAAGGAAEAQRARTTVDSFRPRPSALIYGGLISFQVGDRNI